MRRLDRMGYVGKQEIYLQRYLVPNKFPIDLRGYQYCIACGVDLKKHPRSIAKSNENIQCAILAQGLLDEKIVPVLRDTIGRDEREYTSNFNSRDKVLRRSKATRVDYCPYCGYSHTSDYTNVSNENLFVLAEYWI